MATPALASGQYHRRHRW